MPNIKLSGQIKRSFEFMANVNWENLFNNKPVSVNNTMDTDNPKIKTNITRSTVNIDKSKMTTAQVSAIYRESLVLCDNDNIPDTAQTAEEAIEYFGQKIAAYIETFSKEEVEAYAALVETEGANFINEYIQSNPEGPYDINAIFSSFKTKIENIIKEKQELTDKTTEKNRRLRRDFGKGDVRKQTFLKRRRKGCGDVKCWQKELYLALTSATEKSSRARISKA